MENSRRFDKERSGHEQEEGEEEQETETQASSERKNEDFSGVAPGAVSRLCAFDAGNNGVLRAKSVILTRTNRKGIWVAEQHREVGGGRRRRKRRERFLCSDGRW